MKDKIAQTSEALNENIMKRWSPRAFRDKPVDEAILIKLFEAARWAASSFNEQPWRFVLGQKTDGNETYNKILETLVEFNQNWAQHAPVLVLVCAKNRFSHNDTPNKHCFYDAGQAVTTMALQGMEEGLYMHQMAGFDADSARKAFKVPSAYDPITVLAIGYRAEPDALPSDLQENEEKPRSRKPLEKILFKSEWDHSFNN